ncbi:MAG TPA: YceI family protein [Thermoleophilaceae bacterium]|nr:YceI family protein [Thermoleophilaceae bacterium]
MNSTATSATLIPTGTWTVDPSHSAAGFSVKHLGIATVRGRFEEFEGTLEIGDDLSSARAFGTAQVSSINTDDAGRDEHLRSADFFGAEANPELRFESTAVRPLDEDTFEIEGNLTMNGITKPVTLTAVVEGTETDPWGNDRVGLEVTGRVNRTDWNMTFNQALGSGNLLVGEKVTLSLDISAVKQA